MNLIITGPPGSGKTVVGKLCAEKLDQQFVDVDEQIVAKAGFSIPEIFSEHGEAAFRVLEAKAIAALAIQNNLVIAPGGGALVDHESRDALERSGLVVCLRASADTIYQRIKGSTNRPLVQDSPEEHISQLLVQRKALYDSFSVQIVTDGKNPEEVAQHIAEELIPFQKMVNTPDGAYPAVLGETARLYLPRLLRDHDLPLPQLIISDTNVGPIWAETIGDQLNLPVVNIQAGEVYKTLDTTLDLYNAFLRHGIDRHSLVLAVGGGVVGDVAGFAAATYMRGISWVNMPTSLLAMVDASIGGKVGIDLPQGKNMVGAFHPPELVLADTEMLSTLPPDEYTSGLAEVLKHALIADPELFNALSTAPPLSRSLIQRALSVKIDIVQRDPFECGERAKLNMGHTIGHGIEVASDYALRHGEAIAIGLVAEARLAEGMGLANQGLANRVAAQLQALALPTRCPGLRPERIRTFMSNDKKKRGGVLKFTLPTDIGAVEYGITVEEELLLEVISSTSK